jgi:signal transduction histidine kinase
MDTAVKRFFEKQWVAGGLGLAFLLMGVVSVLSYQNATELIESSDQVNHTHETLEKLTDISATLLDAESGRRGYILSGDQEELERYDNATQSIASKLNILQQFTIDEPSQKQRLEILKGLIHQRVTLLKQSIERYQNNPSIESDQSFLVQQRKQNREQIRAVIAEMQQAEKQHLRQQLQQSQSSIRLRMLIEFLGPFLSFGILFKVYLLLYRQMLKRHQAEALQRTLIQEKELGQLKLHFFSMVSHEFRTPLSNVLGSTELLIEDSHPEEKQKLKNLHRIQSSAKLMTQLLTDILTLTRAEAGKLSSNPELVDLESFCLNLLDDLQFWMDTQHLIEFTSQGECTYAWFDEKLIYSALSNLLSNAMKYSPPQSRIRFMLSCELQEVIFQIQDEGIGIAPEDYQHLCEPFYRGKNTGNTTGTGLGLAVVKTCIDLHQGQIEIESHPGSGTTFTIKIPQMVPDQL